MGSSSRSRSRSPSKTASNLPPPSSALKPAVPPEEPLFSKEASPEPTPQTEEHQVPKQQIRMTLKTSSTVSKAMSKNVLEKLGTNDTTEILENAKAKREENKLKKASEIKK